MCYTAKQACYPEQASELHRASVLVQSSIFGVQSKHDSAMNNIKVYRASGVLNIWGTEQGAKLVQSSLWKELECWNE